METKKITLLSAFLICVNTMFGAGIFINPKQLALLAGPFGFLSYVISGLIILPLVLTLAELARLQPVSGGLYIYSKEYISPTFGFLCSWSYFISKATSLTFLVNRINTYFQARIDFLQTIPPFLLDYAFIIFLIILNIIGVTIGSRIQYVFITMKVLPILFACCAGIICFQPNNFNGTTIQQIDIFSTIPVCLYALVGFEVICAIGGFVENAAVNIRIAILSAFSSVTLLAILYQIVAYGALGSNLAIGSDPVKNLGILLLPTMPYIGNLINGIVFASITAGAFSMTATNCWNFYTIANNNHLPYKEILTKINRNHVPWVALCIQGFFSLFMITLTRNPLALQNMTVFCMFISFLLTTIAAYKATKKGFTNISTTIPLIGMISCLYVLILCCKNIINFGISLPFAALFISGCLLALYKKSCS